MGFPENIKEEVKKKSNSRCCMCHIFILEIHHIIPLSEDGSNEIENAAPLCPNCHTSYGNNPDFRKSIRQMRNHWYEQCAKSDLPPAQIELTEKIDKLYDEFLEQKDNQKEQSELLEQLTDHVAGYFNEQAKQISKSGSIDKLVSISSVAISGTTVGSFISPHAEESQCVSCGLLVSQGYAYCPYCGGQIIG